MKRLYTIPLEEASQTDERDSLGSQLAESGVLDDSAVVEQISSEVPDLQLDGQFRVGEYFAEMFAEELEELANSTFGDLPLFRVGDRYPESGFYEIESAQVEPAQANARQTYVWGLDLKKKGTRNEYLREIQSNTRKTNHEFGNDLEVNLCTPADASAVQWYDGHSREPAEPAETRETEYGDVDIYDLEDGEAALEADDPSLIYKLADYADDLIGDCAVYDTLGQDEKYISNDEGRVRIWEHVYETGHDPEGEIVLDNGLIRLRLDEREGTLSAERYDPEASSGDTLLLTGDSDEGAWTSVSLSDEDVDVYDIDISEIGMIRDKLQITFDVDGSLFVLDAILETGAESILFDNPDAKGQGPIPASLEEMLEPIASERYVDPQASKGLVRRRDVRLTASDE